MKTRIKEEYDADVIKTNEPTEFQTETNRFAINCGVCGGAYFADESYRMESERAAELGIDEPFVCRDCSEEYEELMYR